MKSLSDLLYWLDDLIWGLPMILILVGTGIYLTVRFRFIYQRKVLFHLKTPTERCFIKRKAKERYPALQLHVQHLPTP